MSQADVVIGVAGLLISATGAVLAAFRTGGVKGILAFVFVGVGLYGLLLSAMAALGVVRTVDTAGNNLNPSIALRALIASLILLGIGLALARRKQAT